MTAESALPLMGKHMVVTGAGQGIGAAIVQTLAALGASVSLMGRRLEPLQSLVAQLPGTPGAERHGAVAVDVGDEAAVQKAFAEACTARGPVAVLVNNAGQAESAPFGKTSLALWQQMLNVNLTGTFLCTQAALPGMLEAGWGRVVNVASTAGQRGYPYVAAYVAAKHGVIGLTRSLALEVARKGITVNAVCPGYTETEIMTQSIRNVMQKTGRSEVEARAAFTQSNPQNRLVQPQEVADAVAWLCSAGAAAVTGQSISVSGGEVM